MEGGRGGAGRGGWVELLGMGGWELALWASPVHLSTPRNLACPNPNPPASGSTYYLSYYYYRYCYNYDDPFLASLALGSPGPVLVSLPRPPPVFLPQPGWPGG